VQEDAQGMWARPSEEAGQGQGTQGQGTQGQGTQGRGTEGQGTQGLQVWLQLQAT